MFSPFFNDPNEDPFFGSTMRYMNDMMNSMNSNPFGFENSLIPPPLSSSLMPFQSFSLDRMFPNPLMQMPGQSSGFSSSSTVISMVQGPDGRPQVYKSSSSVKQGPGGIRETKQSEINPVTGTKKMSIGHHIGNKSHILEKEENLNTGDQEENEELVNIDEDELDGFKREWDTKTKQMRRFEKQPLRSIAAPKIRSSPLALPPAILPQQSSPSSLAGSRRSQPHGSTSGPSRKCRRLKNERNL
uniref:Myeloid leukemia factor n=1 Tax=Cuerna arida TaxID=1464854 RepID=A0A1B6F2E8_9HEMI